jgi:hypothetical protein
MSTPYFYIIKNLENGKYYAGSRTSVNADPEELLTENGYKTSSILVKSLINLGTDFVIRRIKIFENNIDALEYETKFLKKVDAKNNSNFYNQCNNVPKDFIFSEDVFRLKYGVSNPSQLSEVQDKIKETSKRKRGVKHHLSDPNVQDRRKMTLKIRYGSEHLSQIPEVMEKIRKTKLERYGSLNNIEKIKKTNLEKYGADNVGHVPDIVAKRGKAISKTKQSEAWNSSRELFRTRLSETLNSEEWVKTKGKKKASLLRERALNRPKLTCPYCQKNIDSSNYARWHGDNCKKNLKRLYLQYNPHQKN